MAKLDLGPGRWDGTSKIAPVAEDILSDGGTFPSPCWTNHHRNYYHLPCWPLLNLPQTDDVLADRSFMSDKAFIISPFVSPRPPAAASPSCSHGSPVLLRLPLLIPALPSSLSPSSPDHPNFDRLNFHRHSAHNEMANELRFLRAASGAEIAEQLEWYMSPSLQDLLKTETPVKLSVVLSRPRRPALEKFQLQNHEKRKPSYKI
ncbi:hypothetical protein B0H14DRAFT_3061312 [Mycena olivaceomarginata]|nr:hypothetical protein B0H14DRAFT_3061312 [Mycena olivaceomarginata]